MQLDALIAEDEDLLRQSLVSQLQRLWPDLRLVAECEDGASALERLAELKPDLALLDIRMPGISGIEVARALPEISPRTQVVFVTAYDQYAIDAFEQGAVDYLLKPVSDERLLATRERILTRMQAGARTVRCWNSCCSGWASSRRHGPRPRRWPGSPPATAAILT